MNALAMNTGNFANNKSLIMRGMKAAISARTKASLDQKSPICIYGLCESNGVSVRFNDINMEGMYDRVPRPRIHLSALRPLGRRAFTCAHELGHHIFGHGSTIDELQDDNLQNKNRHPDEVLADSFASFLLMPTLGLRESFTRRGLNPNTASAIDLYAIACNFGVGQSTLVNHLAYGIEMINPNRRAELGKITPKMIRTELIGEIVSEPLTLVDQHWNSPTLDIEQGNWLILPQGVVADAKILMPHREVSSGRLFQTVQSGITRVAIPGSSWATYVRVARRGYVGLAKYRHLEETNDD